MGTQRVTDAANASVIWAKVVLQVAQLGQQLPASYIVCGVIPLCAHQGCAIFGTNGFYWKGLAVCWQHIDAIKTLSTTCYECFADFRTDTAFGEEDVVKRPTQELILVVPTRFGVKVPASVVDVSHGVRMQTNVQHGSLPVCAQSLIVIRRCQRTRSTSGGSRRTGTAARTPLPASSSW